MIGAGKNFDLSQTDQALGKTSGSLAIFAAILRASSLLSNLAAESAARLILEIDVGELLPVAEVCSPTRPSS